MSLVFYPTVAAVDEAGTKVIIPVHCCVVQANTSLRVKTFGVLARTFKDEQEKQLFQERAKPFLVVSQKGKKVALRLDTATKPGSAANNPVEEGWKISSPSRENGHLFDELPATLEQLQSLGYNTDCRTSSKGPPNWITFSSRMLPDEKDEQKKKGGSKNGIENKEKDDETEWRHEQGSTIEESHAEKGIDPVGEVGDHSEMVLSSTQNKGSRKENKGESKSEHGSKLREKEEKETYFIGKAMLLEEEGVSVVSDIDDTIKLSFVTDKPLFIKNTLLREFQAVPGMAELYKVWEEELGARFHFVSGSPWQLWEPLCSFLEREGFPMGSVHLRKFNVTDKEMYKNSAKSQSERREEKRRKKRLHIEPLLEQFSKRKFIFVGDSGEEDPEVYAQLARKYPGQVKAIFIRRAPDSEKKVSKIVAQTMKRISKEEKEKEKRAKKEKKEREKNSKRKEAERARKNSLASSANRVNNSTKPRVHRTLSDPAMSAAFLKTLREEHEDAEQWKAAEVKAKQSLTPQRPAKDRKRKDLMGSRRRELKERIMEDKKEQPNRRKRLTPQPNGLGYKWKSADQFPPEEKVTKESLYLKERISRQHTGSNIVSSTTSKDKKKKEKQKNNKKVKTLKEDVGRIIPSEPFNVEGGNKTEPSENKEHSDASVEREYTQGQKLVAEQEEMGGSDILPRQEERAQPHMDVASKGGQRLEEVMSSSGEGVVGQHPDAYRTTPVEFEMRLAKKGLRIPNSPKKEVRWRTQELRGESNLLTHKRFGSRGYRPEETKARSHDADYIHEYLLKARKVYRDEKKREKEKGNKEKEKDKDRDKDKDQHQWWVMDEDLALGNDEEGDEGEQKLLDELYHSRKEQEDKRWQELFGSLEGVIWRVFEDPAEIRELTTLLSSS